MQKRIRTCALVAASDFNAAQFLRSWKAAEFDCVIAVDGGFAHVQGAGCAPDVAIGDFDSLGYVPEGDRVIVHPSHKDESDLELALDYAAGQGFCRAVVFGALGGRLDHTLATLQTCMHFAETGMDVSIIAPDYAVSILVGPGSLDLPALAYGTVSVFSAVPEARGVTETGMEYGLEGATMSNRVTRGLSNELVGKPARISVESGTLLVFHPLWQGSLADSADWAESADPAEQGES